MRRARSCLKRLRTSSSENGPPKYLVTSRSPQSSCAKGKSSAVHQRNPSRSLFRKYFSVVSVIVSSLPYYSTEPTPSSRSEEINRRAAPASDRSATPDAQADTPPGTPPPSESAPYTQT